MCASEIFMQSLSTTAIKRIKDEVVPESPVGPILHTKYLQNIETNIIHVMLTNISMYNHFFQNHYV
jgi:hypothetical protein